MKHLKFDAVNHVDRFTPQAKYAIDWSKKEEPRYKEPLVGIRAYKNGATTISSHGYRRPRWRSIAKTLGFEFYTRRGFLSQVLKDTHELTDPENGTVIRPQNVKAELFLIDRERGRVYVSNQGDPPIIISSDKKPPVVPVKVIYYKPNKAKEEVIKEKLAVMINLGDVLLALTPGEYSHTYSTRHRVAEFLPAYLCGDKQLPPQNRLTTKGVQQQCKDLAIIERELPYWIRNKVFDRCVAPYLLLKEKPNGSSKNK